MYSLYYYVETNMIKHNYIEIRDGQIHYDFIDKRGYKAYSYRSSYKNTSFVISNTPNKNFQRIYVYTDPNKFDLDEKTNTCKGYVWTNVRYMGISSSSTDEEIFIDKNDTRFTNDKYYIFVTNNKWRWIKDYSGTFYLTIANEKTPIHIQEGIPHSMLLTNNHFNQSYVYNHPNTNNTLYVSLNLNYGKADIILDFSDKIDHNNLSFAVYRKYDIVSYIY